MKNQKNYFKFGGKFSQKDTAVYNKEINSYKKRLNDAFKEFVIEVAYMKEWSDKFEATINDSPKNRQ